MSIQSTLQFQIRKKSFYGSKKEGTPLAEQQQPQLSLGDSLRSTPSSRYTPTVKKMVEISSSEEDSDVENDARNNNWPVTPKGHRTPKRGRNGKGTEETGSSPPKQMKTLSPTKTPSGMMSQLQLKSPERRHEKLPPKKLFDSDRYSQARRALHSALPDNLTGREDELAKLEEFLEGHLDKRTSASLYISGPPGTGKTACLSKIMLKSKFKQAFQIVYVNCTTMRSAVKIYSKIAEELGLKLQKSGRNSKALIEKHLAETDKMLLLVLDEMDQLETKNQSVLYSIFEWPALPEAKLVLVGIANALDLTDRILPRLQAKCELQPHLLHFKPYSKQQIVDIITKRLEEANVQSIFTGTAVQLLAGKVAAVSGDIRRALDICRRGVEIAESDKMMHILKPTNDNGVDIDGILSQANTQESTQEKPVDFKEIRTVLNGVYGGSQNVDSEESSFPLQQKIILCSLMLILNKGRNKDVNLGRLYQVYKNVCTKRKMSSLDMSDFVSLCTLIETRGIFRLIVKKESRLTKVSMQWDQDMLNGALQDKALTSEIIDDISCL